MENIQKKSGFPEELLIKERDLLLVILTKFNGSSPKRQYTDKCRSADGFFFHIPIEKG